MFYSAIRRSADMRSSTASSASVQKTNLPSRRVATIPARRICCRCCDALATERPVRSAGPRPPLALGQVLQEFEPMRVRQRFGDGRELGEQRHGTEVL